MGLVILLILQLHGSPYAGKTAFIKSSVVRKKARAFHAAHAPWKGNGMAWSNHSRATGPSSGRAPSITAT
jgi:hypothetical protein